MTERIQKALATAGIASRRAIEEMIRDGRVQVNGRVAEIGQKVDHDDHVRVDGRLVKLARKDQPTRVLLYRKKVGEVVTRDDPEGRRTVFRKLPELDAGRWIAVGRLDINTSGLLLLTNDGELARRLMHPSFEIKRRYSVRVLGELTDDMRSAMLDGVELEDGRAHFETLVRGENEDPDDDSANIWWSVSVGEGRKRVVRRLFESQGLQVSRLIRVAYGPVQLGRGIKAGSYRESTPEERNALLAAVGMTETSVQPAAAQGRESGQGKDKPARSRTARDARETSPRAKPAGPWKSKDERRAASGAAAKPAVAKRDQKPNPKPNPKPDRAGASGRPSRPKGGASAGEGRGGPRRRKDG